MDFFITNINAVSSLNLKLLHITLPLGISFFTFTQIAYLVDTARGTIREDSLLNYALFVTFFPVFWWAHCPPSRDDAPV